MTDGRELLAAVEVMDRLRSIGGWEAQQTHESLRTYLLEETYELLDAIAAGNPDDIREELGDLLLQVLFHSRIAADNAVGAFDVDDVAATLVAKLTHRSPHLSDPGSGPIDIAAQERAWEERKAAEKARASCLDGIALSQPALALAEKVLTRTAAAGLPPDLVPDELRVVRIEIGGAAEDRLRRDVLAFAARVRAAEVAARAVPGAARAVPGAARAGGEALTDQVWRRHWA